MKDMADQNEKCRVKLVRSTYQPKKAEVEEEIEIRNPDGTVPTAEEIAAAVIQPVEVEWVDSP